jgi:GntR family transcriptional regulator, transcriptional repressor for pyruvate dehydrogenase complex
MSERDDRLTRRSVATQAADGIRAMIIDGRLRPGDVLPSERQLAVELRISRPTVRQAISSLTAMNILEVRPGGGMFVTDLTPCSLSAPLRFLLQVDPRSHQHLLETRSLIEPGLARLAAERATPAALTKLARHRGAEHAALDRPAEFVHHYLAFHRAITEAAANPISCSLADSVLGLCEPLLRERLTELTRRREVLADHAALEDACRRGDGGQAEFGLHEHLRALMREE